MTSKEEIEQGVEKLWDDYLNLCGKYGEILPVQEFGFQIIRFTTKMLSDCAPKEGLAKHVIDAGVNEGILWHEEDKKNAESKSN